MKVSKGNSVPENPSEYQPLQVFSADFEILGRPLGGFGCDSVAM